MKKYILSLTVAAAVVGATIVGCGSDDLTPGDTTGTDSGTPTPTPTPTTTSTTDPTPPAPKTFAVGGQVAGLVGKGLVLQNNGGDDLAVDADGKFTFKTKLEKGKAFEVSIKSQPTTPNQTCVVTGEKGTIASGDVTSVVVNCTTEKYTVSGTLSGLDGTGLVLTSNGEDVAVAANGGFSFMPQDDGSAYDVTVKTQPTAKPQTCTVTDGKGTLAGANVTNVTVACETNSYDVGGTVTGLTGGTLVLTNNGADDKSITTDGAFAFATKVKSGDAYDVAVKTNPAGHVCSVAKGSGTVGDAAITDVTVSCKTSRTVFVSSEMYTGNMGGLTGADKNCQDLADAAGLGGKYFAWLSDSTTSPSARFTKSTIPYVLPDGTKVANDWNDLIDGGLLSAINMTEKNGATPIGNTSCAGGGYPTVWSGTSSNGTGSTAICGDWKSTTGGGQWGRADQTSGVWSQWCSGGSCAWTSPIYCFQQ